MNISATKSPAVVIVGAAFPRSGTASVMRNQIEFYRSRGYVTVFVCVATHCSLVETNPDWQNIRDGILELGADQTFFAPIDNRRFKILKYVTWVEHLFRGTALDWIVFTGRSARLPDDVMRSVRQLPMALIHVNHVFTLGFAQRLLRQVVRSDERVPMILETHDILAEFLHGRGEINPWTHGHDPVDRLLHSELSYLGKSEVLVHLSVDDFNFFKLRLPHKRHVLVMPTIDETFVSDIAAAHQSSTDSFDLLFVGTSTDPNRAAIKWFFEQVWPLIADRGYGVKIVGQVDLLVRTSLPDIYEAYRSYFVGPIAIAELRSAYRAARCVFAPMVSGTGISIKTIEALALGKPFVGTSKAYRGMPMDLISQAGLQAHDSPQEFANAIIRALSQEQQAAAASRRAYDAVFSKQAAFASRDEALRLATAS
jgi:glycosyltransferase involved in cell wall biosynthesis